MKKREKGIYCLWVDKWFDSLKHKNSVEHVLALLRDSPLSVLGRSKDPAGGRIQKEI
jgi:hypothetical protein